MAGNGTRTRNATRIRKASLLTRLAATLPLLALLPMVFSTGCSFGEIYIRDPLLREAALAEVQLRYTSLVRWSAVHKAARFVKPEAREDFIALLPELENFRFTDFESEPVTIDEESGEATVHVTYKGYSVRSSYEIKVEETQHWSRPDITNNWQVTSEFEGLGKNTGLAQAH